jgi:hypothetical protein
MNVMDVGHDLENVFIDIITEIINTNVNLLKVQNIRNKQEIKIVI